MCTQLGVVRNYFTQLSHNLLATVWIEIAIFNLLDLCCFRSQSSEDSAVLIVGVPFPFGV